MSEEPTLSIMLLGAGQEVGRSCCVLRYQGKTVVCDTGIHPAHSGISSLPFIDELDWSTVDAILITHFHMDHAAALPYIVEKTNFRDGKGQIYMTQPTKSLYKLMMQDMSRMSASDTLFSPSDLARSLEYITPVSAHQHITVSQGLTFTSIHAGHVLGACMFLIDLAGLKILYTGDYSREEDRHLVKAQLPPVQPDVLIVESTHGTNRHEARDEREARLTKLVHNIIKRGGRTLLPTSAVGNAQELLLVLEDYWKKHSDLHKVPIYYVSALARKCMAVYQSNVHTMNSDIRGRFARKDNPFSFQYISNLPQTSGWEKNIRDGPCVVLASPGMLQAGASRELLELWAPDPRNGVIITGYSVEGTMARDILKEPDEIPSLKNNKMIPRLLSVDQISFSAHVDYIQNSEFINLVKAPHVVLVHGERTAMGRLKAALEAKYRDNRENVKIYTPRNLEELELKFPVARIAKVIGKLASEPPYPGKNLTGLLVNKDYSHTIVDPQELKEFTGLSNGDITQRQRVVLGVGWDLVCWHLEGMYGKVAQGVDENGIPTAKVMGSVNVKHTKEHEIALEWDSNSTNDIIADACLSLIMGIDKSPASLKLTSDCASQQARGHGHIHPHAQDSDKMNRTQKVVEYLQAYFSQVELRVSEPRGDENTKATLIVGLDDDFAQVNLATFTVVSDNESLKKRVESILDMASTALSSLDELYASTL